MSILKAECHKHGVTEFEVNKNRDAFCVKCFNELFTAKLDATNGWKRVGKIMAEGFRAQVRRALKRQAT